MADQSGVDALLDALKKSGMDVDKNTFTGEGGPSNSSSTTQNTQTGKSDSGKSTRGSSRGRGNSRRGGFGEAFKQAAQSGFGGMGGFGGPGNGDSADDGSGRGGFGGFGRRRAEAGDDDMPGPDAEIISGIKDRFSEFSRGGKIGITILVILILAAAYWWFHPPINIQSPDTWFIIVVVCVIAFILLGGSSLFDDRRAKKAKKAQGQTGDVKSKAAEAAKSGGLKRKLALIPVIVIAIGLVGWLLSQSFFPGNAAKYSSILKTQNLEFATDISQVDYSEIPVIDHDAAEILGDKQMGTIPEYVSQFEVDSLYSQINFQGSPVRVSPLNYADLFKWLTNREQGIPAYVVVNMTTQDAQVIRVADVDGVEGEGIKYSASEPLARNIDRYVQLKYPFYMFDDKSFEIDESGHPWWICPVQTKTIGLFGGTTISRIVLCDAVTGECQDMAIEDVPEWVDRAYPSDLVLQQYNWYGAYNNGWINSWLGQKDVVKTTPGTDGESGYNYIAKDDDVWVYTGVTSATSDSSIIGFVLVNQRTAESHFYSVAGATEESAMDSAEGQVQNLRYTATFPILINVSSQPTYFMALKDSAGTVKKFAMIDIQRYQNVAVGDTVAECQKSYEALLATNGVDLGATGDLQTASGTISRIAQAVIDSNSHFYVKLEGDSAIYDFALPSMIDIVGYGIGDPIKFTYIQGTSTSAAQQILSTDATSANSNSASNSNSSNSSSASNTSNSASSNASSSTSASPSNSSGGANASSTAA